MRRLVPVAAALLLASCAAAVTTDPEPSRSIDRPAATTAGLDYPEAPPTAQPLPIATASVAASTDSASTAVLGESVASAEADFDCDGRSDRLQFLSRAAVVPGDANTIARLALATGGLHELMLVASVEGTPLIGVTDVNGDGCDDAIMSLDRGASTIRATFLVYDRGDLRVVEEDGRPATFLFGGSVRHGNAIECRRTKDAAEIVVRSVSDYKSDFQWDAVEDVHHWASKSELVLWSTTPSVILVNVRFAMPPDAQRYWGLSCGGVKLGY